MKPNYLIISRSNAGIVREGGLEIRKLLRLKNTRVAVREEDLVGLRPRDFNIIHLGHDPELITVATIVLWLAELSTYRQCVHCDKEIRPRGEAWEHTGSDTGGVTPRHIAAPREADE